MADEKQTFSLQPQADSPEAQSPDAQIPDTRLRDKRILPEGVVPKQAQGYVIAGLAVLILMAVMFSKNHAKPAPKETTSSPPAMSTDVNQRKIQELEQDLSADQRQSQQQAMAQKNMNSAAVPGGVPAPMQPNGAVNGTAAPSDPVADAEKVLAFKSRFASNLVSADDGASHPSAEPVSLGESTAARSSSLPPTPPTQAAATPAAANNHAPEIN